MIYIYNLTSIKEIKNLFANHGFSLTKSLGQNFLINPSICPKIAELGGSGENTTALEIGTGVGVLTKELAIRCKNVVAIEIDRGLKPILDETLSDFDNIEIIFGDIMKLDISKILQDKVRGVDLICCANLPYYITSPVIMKLLESEIPLRSITVMVQKEAGERITALPGTRECGSISAAVRFYSEPKKLFNVSKGSFMPSPKVDSLVIRLDLHSEKPYKVKDKELYFKIIHSVFAQRRKQIINPLSDVFGLNKSIINELLTSIGINPTARAENLSSDDFFGLYKVFIPLNY